ncbi:MAG TPA: hypothetical protein VK686_13260 [Bryobacteraceae bacterium]|nr:hypothetical protein [Bryobacteraceae bacterium]
MDPARQLLRHSLATLAYRAAKPLRGAPDSFCKFKASADARTPVEILAHMGDLFDWALSSVRGEQRWHNAAPQPWSQEADRFFAALVAFDAYLASDKPLHATPEALLQGPIADALTHVGQIALLRRLVAAPVRPENYYIAQIVVGTVGADQAAPVLEF